MTVHAAARVPRRRRLAERHRARRLRRRLRRRARRDAGLRRPARRVITLLQVADRKQPGTGRRHDARRRGTTSLADYRGKVVVVNVWGSWCPPCRAEAPVLADAARDLSGKGVAFLGHQHRGPRALGAAGVRAALRRALPLVLRPRRAHPAGLPRHAHPELDPEHARLDSRGRVAAASSAQVTRDTLRRPASTERRRWPGVTPLDVGSWFQTTVLSRFAAARAAGGRRRRCGVVLLAVRAAAGARLPLATPPGSRAPDLRERAPRGRMLLGSAALRARLHARLRAVRRALRRRRRLAARPPAPDQGVLGLVTIAARAGVHRAGAAAAARRAGAPAPAVGLAAAPLLGVAVRPRLDARASGRRSPAVYALAAQRGHRRARRRARVRLLRSASASRSSSPASRSAGRWARSRWVRRHQVVGDAGRRRRCSSWSGCCWSPACGTSGSATCARGSAASRCGLSARTSRRCPMTLTDPATPRPAGRLPRRRSRPRRHPPWARSSWPAGRGGSSRRCGPRSCCCSCSRSRRSPVRSCRSSASTPVKVRQLQDAHPTLAPSSTARPVRRLRARRGSPPIYLLLFVSLVGCVVPRLRIYCASDARPTAARPAPPERLPDVPARTRPTSPPSTCWRVPRRSCGASASGWSRTSADGTVVGGEGLPARGRQPGLPLLGPRAARRLRARAAVRLQGQRDHDRRPGLLQLAEPVRRLHAGGAVRAERPRAA